MENAEIPLLGLDEWLDSSPSAPQSIDLLNIDVEGMELRRGQLLLRGLRLRGSPVAEGDSIEARSDMAAARCEI